MNGHVNGNNIGHIVNPSLPIAKWSDDDLKWLHDLASTILDSRHPNKATRSYTGLDSASMSEDLFEEVVEAKCPGFVSPVLSNNPSQSSSSLAATLNGQSEDNMSSTGGSVKNEEKLLTFMCKRKPKQDCLYKMCANCCLQKIFFLKKTLPADRSEKSIKLCPAHANARAKREEEDRWIKLCLLGEIGKKKKRKLHHFEDRLKEYGQTVLIWYIGDFLQNKKISDEVIAACLRKVRQRGLRKKRDEAYMRQMIALDMPVKDAAESKNEDETEDYTERSKELSTVEKTVASTFQTRRGRSIAKKSRAYKRRCQVHMKAAIRWTKLKAVWESLPTYGCTSWILEGTTPSDV